MTNRDTDSDPLSERVARRLTPIAAGFGLWGIHFALSNIGSSLLAALFVVGIVFCIGSRAYLDGLIDGSQLRGLVPAVSLRQLVPSRSTTRAVMLTTIMVLSLPAMFFMPAMHSGVATAEETNETFEEDFTDYTVGDDLSNIDWSFAETSSSQDEESITVVDDTALSGSQSLKLDSAPDHQYIISDNFNPDTPTTEDLQFSMKRYSDGGTEQSQLHARQNGDTLMDVELHGDGLGYRTDDGSGGTEFILEEPDAVDGEWVDIWILDIDPTAETYTVEYQSPSASGSFEAEFRDDVENDDGYNEIVLSTFSDVEGYFDDIVVGDTSEITGQVFDEYGSPLEGAQVAVDGRVAESGPDGHYSLFVTDPGEYRVFAETNLDIDREDVDVPEEGVTGVNFELTRGDMQVVDQNGDAVPGATVIASGPRESVLDADPGDAEALREEADELLDEISGDVRPDYYDENLDVDSTWMEPGSFEEVVVAHERGDWDMDTWNLPKPILFSGGYNPNVDLSDPLVQTDQTAITLSIWDTTWDPFAIGEPRDTVNKELPGKPVSGSIVVERLGLNGEVMDSRTVETEEWATISGGETNRIGLPIRYGSNTYEVRNVNLNEGNFYRIYPEGNPDGAYSIAVGDPDEFVNEWKQDIRNEAGELTDEAERIQELVDKDDIWIDRAVTDDRGVADLEDMPDDVPRVDTRAFRGPLAEELVAGKEAGIIDHADLEQVTMQDVRELQSEGILDDSRVFIASRDRDSMLPVQMQGEYIGGASHPGDPIKDWDADESLNETLDDPKEYLDTLEEMIDLRDELVEIASEYDGFDEHFEEHYPEYVDDDGAIDFDEPQTQQEAAAQIEALRDAISSVSGVQDGRVDWDIDEDVGETLTTFVDIPEQVNSLDMISSVIIEYADEPRQLVDDEDMEVRPDSNELFIDDVELESTAVTSVDVEFAPLYDDVDEEVGEAPTELTMDIAIPSDVTNLSELAEVEVVYVDGTIEEVPSDDLRLDAANDTLEIVEYDASGDEIETVEVTFADSVAEIDDPELGGGAEVIDTEIPVDETVDEIALEDTDTHVVTRWDVDEDHPQAINDSELGTVAWEVIDPEYMDVRSSDVTGVESVIDVSWPIPEQLDSDQFIDFRLESLTRAEDEIIDPIDDIQDSSRVIDGTFALDDSVDTLDNITVEINYLNHEAEVIDDEYLTLDAETDELTISDYPVGEKSVGYIDITGEHEERIGDVDDSTNIIETSYLDGEYTLTDPIDSLDDITVEATYQEEPTEEIPDAYLSLNADGDTLLIDDYPIGDKTIDTVEISGGTDDTITDVDDDVDVGTGTVIDDDISLGATIESLDDVSIWAYWADGTEDEIGDEYLSLRPDGETVSITSFPTDGKELRSLDVSIARSEVIDTVDESEYLDAEISFDDGLFDLSSLDESDVEIFIEWQDGTVETIPSEYWSVDGQLTGIGTLIVEGFPIPEDKAAGEVEVIARAGDQLYSVGERIESPSYPGEPASLEYVATDVLRPGVDQTVRLETGLANDLTSVEMVDAEVVSPRGNVMEADIDADETIRFTTTDGTGTYQVQLYYEDVNIEDAPQFQRTIPVEATTQGSDHTPLVHEMDSDQNFAFVSGGLIGGNVERFGADGSKSIETAIPSGEDPPSSVHIHPEVESDIDTYDFSIRQGENRETVRSHVSAVFHLPVSDDALVYREGTQPITTDGSNAGEVNKADNVIRTYTDDAGEVQIQVIQDPSLVQRAMFQVRTLTSGLSIPLLAAIPSPSLPTAGAGVGIGAALALIMSTVGVGRDD